MMIRDKIWIRSGVEYGSDLGWNMIKSRIKHRFTRDKIWINPFSPWIKSGIKPQTFDQNGESYCCNKFFITDFLKYTVLHTKRLMDSFKIFSWLFIVLNKWKWKLNKQNKWKKIVFFISEISRDFSFQIFLK
jgi:hypothetical protein